MFLCTDVQENKKLVRRGVSSWKNFFIKYMSEYRATDLWFINARVNILVLDNHIQMALKIGSRGRADLMMKILDMAQANVQKSVFPLN